MQNEATNSDSSLTDKMEKDVERLIENKKPKDNAPEAAPVPTETTEKDEKKSNIYATVDGHMVKSNMEQVIDDILWNAGILHAYEQPISEFVYERKKCDWFIPIIGSEQGIYIEYWGMKTQKYLEDRKEKVFHAKNSVFEVIIMVTKFVYTAVFVQPVYIIEGFVITVLALHISFFCRTTAHNTGSTRGGRGRIFFFYCFLFIVFFRVNPIFP